jgi:hypothetical protein
MGLPAEGQDKMNGNREVKNWGEAKLGLEDCSPIVS